MSGHASYAPTAKAKADAVVQRAIDAGASVEARLADFLRSAIAAEILDAYVAGATALVAAVNRMTAE